MAFIKQEKKADPKWLPAIWLGNVADHSVILVTRSIRRLPDAFNLEMCGDIESRPWDHGFAALGHKRLTTKRYQTGGPVPIVPFQSPGMPDQAAEDPPSDVEGSKLSHGDVLGDGSTGAPKMEPVVPAVAEQQEQPEAKEGVSAKAGMKPPPLNAVAGEVEMDRATSSAPLVIVSVEMTWSWKLHPDPASRHALMMLMKLWQFMNNMKTKILFSLLMRQRWTYSKIMMKA